MIDQSFSIDNFRKIFEIENRKGNFIRAFYSEEFHKYSEDLKVKREEIRAFKKSKLMPQEDNNLVQLQTEKTEIEEKKQHELENNLCGFVNIVNDRKFKFELSKFLHGDSGKEVYPVKKDAPSYFAMKQLQHNINKTFKVKQSNRYLITRQVQLLLKDNYPKIVIRTDIESFYESVSQSKLLDLINDNQLLSPKSKGLVKRLLYSYNELTNQLLICENERKGIPRGAGVSAFLAELYMRNIDNKIKRLPNVSYYARYVDDLVVLFMKDSKTEEVTCKKEIKKIVNEYCLTLNEKKTETFDLSKSNPHKINILGYEFLIKENKYNGTYLSQNKKEKYLLRISKSIDDYLSLKKYFEKEATKLLIHRFNYLTKNTRLHKPKRGLLIRRLITV